MGGITIGTSNQLSQRYGSLVGMADRVGMVNSKQTVAGGLADALRAYEAPRFEVVASQLFSNSDGDLRARLLSALMETLGVDRPIGRSVAGGLFAQFASRPMTPQDALAISPAAVQELAQAAHHQDPAIVDRVCLLYAEHPAQVMTLSESVLSLAIAKISARMSS